MSAVEAYHNFRQATGEAVTEESQRADAAIAELEAEQAATDKAFELRKYLDTEQIWELRKRAEAELAPVVFTEMGLHRCWLRPSHDRLCHDVWKKGASDERG